MSYTLRDLPLPVKVVATVFLLAVGVGYTSAMVQLHVQDAKGGTPMPSRAEVVKKYTGKQWFDGPPPPPVSQLEALVMGPVEGAPWNGTGSMAPAFFHKDSGQYNRLVKANPADKPRIDAERNGEREVVRWWVNAPADVRKDAYENDKCVIGPDKAPKQITGDFKHDDGSFKIKSIIEERCARCHSAGGGQDKYPLETYAHFKKYLEVPPVPVVPQGGGWAKVSEPVSMEKLTQSTHAHLLSFAVLFSLTGVIFAFSSYPTIIRVILAPWVVIAVFVDVSFWWLARFSDQWGPVFAEGIIYTGIAAGGGLFGQITLSLFNLYGWKGKLVMGGLFLLGAGIAGLVWVNKIAPALNAKANQVQAQQQPKPEEKKPDDKKPEERKVEPPKNGNGKTTGPSKLEQVLLFPVKTPEGKELSPLELPFKKDRPGGMVRAFFNRDEGEFNDMMKDPDMPQAEKDKFVAKRFGELTAVRAWVKLADPQRKAAYESDSLELPAELTGKPITDDFLKDGKVKVKSILTNRCARCHVPGGDNEDVLLDSYENISKALAPMPAKEPTGDVNANGVDVNPVPPAPAPAPAPAKAAVPIPAAKDD